MSSPAICQWSRPDLKCLEPEWDTGAHRCILHSDAPEKDAAAFQAQVLAKLDAQDCNFAGAVFPSDVDFGQKDLRSVDFRLAQFKGVANFSKATFGPFSAGFSGAKFNSQASFNDANFQCPADFPDALFATVQFVNTRFEYPANFRRATFGDTADFEAAHFLQRATFQETRFDGLVSFVRAEFKGGADFASAQFEEEVNFVLTSFNSSEMEKFSYDPALRLFFEGSATFFRATFAGRVYFAAIEFGRGVDFELAHFTDAVFFSTSQLLVPALGQPGSQVELAAPLPAPPPRLRMAKALFEQPERVRSARDMTPVGCGGGAWSRANAIGMVEAPPATSVETVVE